MARPDNDWDVDLIKKYLLNTSGPGIKTGEWYKHMDPNGKLNNRHYVYDMLTGKTSTSNTSPNGSNIGVSMIPWNQRNEGILKAFRGITRLPCGSMVKLTFAKYMGWPFPKEPSNRSTSFPKWNAILWIVKSLRAGKPVRAKIHALHHYVGIVGFRDSIKFALPRPDETATFDFLCIDPWAGGARTGSVTIKYAKETAFLGIAHQVGTRLKYDGAWITEVGGFFPF